MFSSRLHWDLKPNPISKLLANKRHAGIPILDLTESNPTTSGLKYPVEEMVAAFADSHLARYEPNPAGMWSARDAVCSHLGGLYLDRLFLTASTSEAYTYLFKLLTDPGDEVLVPRPSYPLFEFLAGMELLRVKQYPLRYEGRWEIDFAALEELVTARTRAVVLVNPNNPTGSFLHRNELGLLVDFCQRHELAIISDEVFSEYVLSLPGDEIRSLQDVDAVLTFSMSGLSKLAGMPQMKLGWIAVNGPAKLRDEALANLELIADTYLSVGTPVQVAAARLLEIGRRIRAEISSRTARNLSELSKRVQTSACNLLKVEGGWYAPLRVPQVKTEEERVLELLDRDNVLVQPGYFYDFESEAYLIVSLLAPEAVFDAGVEKILASL
jgi:alanine-synthesizing transaminase